MQLKFNGARSQYPKLLAGGQFANDIIDGIPLENLRASVQQEAQSDQRFNKDSGGDNSGMKCGCWIMDIIKDGDKWSAIIQAANGKSYQVSFDIVGTKATLAANSQEVIRKTSYVPA